MGGVRQAGSYTWSHRRSNRQKSSQSPGRVLATGNQAGNRARSTSRSQDWSRKQSQEAGSYTWNRMLSNSNRSSGNRCRSSREVQHHHSVFYRLAGRQKMRLVRAHARTHERRLVRYVLARARRSAQRLHSCVQGPWLAHARRRVPRGANSTSLTVPPP